MDAEVLENKSTPELGRVTPDHLECIKVTPDWEQPLSAFFADLVANGDEKFFHPHPFSASEAKRIAGYTGRDLYYVLVCDSQVLGYAMLRGWDEGYQIPSLGIALHPSSRGLGLGKLMMLYVQAAARLRGSKQIRLRVCADNAKALTLYQDLGYVFQGEEDGQLLGFVSL